MSRAHQLTLVAKKMLIGMEAKIKGHTPSPKTEWQPNDRKLILRKQKYFQATAESGHNGLPVDKIESFHFKTITTFAVQCSTRVGEYTPSG